RVVLDLMVEDAAVAAARHRKRSALDPRPAGARHPDQEVAEEAAERVLRIAGDRRGDEVVGDVIEERDRLRRRRGPEGVEIAALPVLVDEGAVPQILDPRAAAGEEARGDPRARGVDRRERGGGEV